MKARRDSLRCCLPRKAIAHGLVAEHRLHEILHPPRAWAERAYNITRWTDMKSGGHFAALEEPDALAADIRTFFRRLR